MQHNSGKSTDNNFNVIIKNTYRFFGIKNFVAQEIQELEQKIKINFVKDEDLTDKEILKTQVNDYEVAFNNFIELFKANSQYLKKYQLDKAYTDDIINPMLRILQDIYNEIQVASMKSKGKVFVESNKLDNLKAILLFHTPESFHLNKAFSPIFKLLVLMGTFSILCSVVTMFVKNTEIIKWFNLYLQNDPEVKLLANITPSLFEAANTEEGRFLEPLGFIVASASFAALVKVTTLDQESKEFKDIQKVVSKSLVGDATDLLKQWTTKSE